MPKSVLKTLCLVDGGHQKFDIKEEAMLQLWVTEKHAEGRPVTAGWGGDLNHNILGMWKGGWHRGYCSTLFLKVSY